jgi:hypothetical protein
MGFIPFVPTGGNVTLPVPVVDGGTGAATAAGAATNLAVLPLTGGTLTGATGLTVITGPEVISDGSVKEYRFRTSGTNLDFDAAGADLFLSVFSAFGFGGTQHTYARYESGVQLTHLIGQVVFGTGGSDTPVTITPATGTIDISLAGGGLRVAEGANAKQGTAVLNGTTAVVVTNTSVTANSRIFLTINTPAGTPGSPYVSAVVAATSFSIKSTGAADTSTVAYEIFEPG